MHNRVTMIRRLHGFWMDDDIMTTKLVDKFDELIVGLQSLNEPVDEALQLSILLSSMPADYELIASIVENAHDITLIEVKKKLIKEYERQEKKEATESALKATIYGGKSKNARFDKCGRKNGREDKVSRNRIGFKGEGFNYDKFGHM
uniref:Polyprotein n=1 Tax=Peronospora matthiolae TaxID=2874970 RepID=A0AAV1TDJ7_9STRA